MDPLTLGALALAAVFIFGGKKKKKPTTPGTGDLPTDVPTDGPTPGGGGDEPKPPSEPTNPGEPAHIPSDVIGGGWTWDEKDVWPSEGSIAGALVGMSKGRYAPGGNFAMPNYTITGVSGQGAVKQFQRDWNELVDKNHWTLFTKAGSTKPTGKLSVDGWIGKNTWKAMRWAFRRSADLKNVPGADPYMHWNSVIDGARAL